MISAWWLLLIVPVALGSIPLGFIIGVELIAKIGDWKKR